MRIGSLKRSRDKWFLPLGNAFFLLKIPRKKYLLLSL